MAISRATTAAFKTGAWRNVTPRYVRRLPPCRAGCPVGNDVMGWVTAAARGDWPEAARLLAAEQPLPGVCGRVCYRPCESACNRLALDEAVSIRAVERHLGEIIAQWRKPQLEHRRTNLAARVLVVGSGPAGLAAAWVLARLGYEVELHERSPEAGGLLRYGIPAYRLPREVLNREIERIIAWGVKTRCDARWERSRGVGILAQEYEAIFLSPGAVGHHSSGIVSQTAQKVMEAGEFLSRAAMGKPPDLRGDLREEGAPRVVVIGGGNSALDAARTALRLGARAMILYRRTRVEMPAYAEEIEAALEEGVRIDYLVSPSFLLHDSHGYPVLRCLRNVLGKPDRDGRRRPEPIPGSEFDLAVSFVIDAVGDFPDPIDLTADKDEAQMLRPRDSWGRTGIKNVWVGGDFGGGDRTVAHAIGAGKRAAAAIHRQLSGMDDDPAGLLLGVEGPLAVQGLLGNGSPPLLPSYFVGGDRYGVAGYDDCRAVAPSQVNLAYFRRAERMRQPALGAAVRVRSFDEVEGGVVEAGLRSEASRCFHCGACDDCGNCHVFCPDGAVVRGPGDGRLAFDLDHCKGCCICAEECPRGAIEMVR